MIDFKGSYFEKEIIRWGVRWYVAYPLSYRQLEEMRGERGGAVDHSTLTRWVSKYAPEGAKPFRRRQQMVGTSGRRDETSVRVRGQGQYCYRAVDSEGHTIDLLLTPKRDRDAAAAFLHQALRRHGDRRRSRLIRGGATRPRFITTPGVARRLLRSARRNLSLTS